MKKLKFGIIGFGYFGKFYARILRDTKDVELTTVADPQFETHKDKDILLPSVAQTSNFMEIIQDEDIDCVIISTPPSTHLLILESAIDAGKHILLEKPAVSNSEEIDVLENILSRNKKCFMVGHIYFYNDYLQEIKRTIEQGLLGNIRYVSFIQSGHGPIRTDVNCFWDMGVHHISILEYLFGPLVPTQIGGYSSSMISGGRRDFISVHLEYPNGVNSDIAVSWFMPEKERIIKIIGDKGSIVFDDIKKKLRFFNYEYPKEGVVDKGLSVWLDNSVGDGAPLVYDENIRNPQQNEINHFIHCVKTGEEPQTGTTHTIRVMRILDDISKAIS